ncbi:MAG: MFS transporter [Armatimonadota bacterium]|nr:MFS transporter [Armatimonadota bacterium]MDR7452941.1 MFS transporter [Armatimonadota bacterium]MDR7456341.1 MFS transporter [Armatimonadota bacterium]MDR7496998.1 MFS transporter [Armatimonadota bacterium]MDR7510748.1 MFS transporter [Armatimonadota bacterium]
MSTAAAPPVPAAVRRNTWLLFLAQASLSTGLAAGAQLGSLIAFDLSGTASFAGVPTAITALTVAVVGYPAGRLMDRRGRRPGLMLGFAIGALGALLMSLAVFARALGPYFLAVAVFSVGVAIGQLTRAAVADMYPAARRAGAVGLVVTGGLVGGLGGPMLVALGQRLAQAVGTPPLATPWLFMVGTFGAAAVALATLRPDPREIAARLPEFFPNTGAAPIPTPHAGHAWPARAPTVRELAASRSAQAAMIALACAQATMVMLMATSSLMLSMHGHGMDVISIALMAHVFGMFGLSVPIGRVADRAGRRPVLVGGALLSASSGLVFTTGVHSAAIAVTAFLLVGLGWCLAFVAGSALLADVATTATRGRLVALSDVLTHASAMVAALLSGVLLARGGELTVGTLAAVLGSVPLLALARAGRAPAPVPVATVAGGR